MKLRNTMKLVLKNFRCHRDGVYVIPDSGLHLLCGESGVGKSSLLSAIIFALYGKAKNPYTHGTKSCSVTLEMSIHDMKIVRTTPNKRILVYKPIESKNYIEGDEAEGQIISSMGMTYEEFMASSVVRQNIDSSVLSMTPSEQTKFIETIAFNNDSHQEKKEVIKERINFLYSEKLRSDGELTLLSKQYEGVVKELSLCKPPKKPPKEPQELRKDLKIIQAELKNKTEIYMSQQKELSNIRAEISNRDSLSEKKSVIAIELEHLAKKQNELQNKNGGYNDQKSLESLRKEMVKLENKRDLVMGYRTLEKEKRRFSELCTSHFEELKESKTKLEKNMVIDEKEYEKINETIEKIRLELSQNESLEKEIEEKEDSIQKIQDIRAEVKTMFEAKNVATTNTLTKFLSTQLEIFQIKLAEMTTMKCPCCKELLYVNPKTHSLSKAPNPIEKKNQESLIASYQTKIDKILSMKEDLKLLAPLSTKKIVTSKPSDIEKSKKLLKELTTKIESTQGNKNYYDEICKQISSKILSAPLVKFESQIKIMSTNLKLPRNFKAPTDSEFDNESKKLSEMQELYDQTMRNLAEIESIKKEIKNKTSQLKTVEDLISKSKNTATKNKISSLESSINKYLLERQTLEVRMDEINLTLEKMGDYEKYQMLAKKVDSIKKELDDAQERTNGYEIQLGGAVGLEEAAKHAELLALDRTIESINAHAKGYLDEMFNEPISVRLENIKQTKKTTKLQMNVIIEYKSGTFTNIEELSGGERQRCNLAFLLAVNDMLGSRILLLDECLNNLDAQTNSDILTYLKNLCFGKLVIVVSHEAVTGIFDSVLSVSHRTD